MSDSVSPYDILGIPKNASMDEIRKAYYRLSRAAHPDMGGSNGLFLTVTKAYESLSSSTKVSESEVKVNSDTPVTYPTYSSQKQTYTRKEERTYPETNGSSKKSKSIYWPQQGKKSLVPYENYYQRFEISYSSIRGLKALDAILVIIGVLIVLCIIVPIDALAKNFGTAFLFDLSIIFLVFGSWSIVYLFIALGRWLFINIFFKRRKQY